MNMFLFSNQNECSDYLSSYLYILKMVICINDSVELIAPNASLGTIYSCLIYCSKVR